MSDAFELYLITLLVLVGINLIAVWGLNLQFGYGGILNFAYVVFLAAGAYTTGVLTLGPSEGVASGVQQYIIQAELPWPLPTLAAAGVGGLLAYMVGLFALRPRQEDYRGIVLIAVALMAGILITTQEALFNGAFGLVQVPQPFQEYWPGDTIGYGWFYAGLTAAWVMVVLLIVNGLTGSPWGRALRAMRENPVTLRSVGISPDRMAMQAFVIGGAIAALAGSIFVQFVTAYSPASWTIRETFLYFVCVTVGGRANNLGAAVGAILVLTVIVHGVQYFPQFGFGNVAAGIQGMLVGLLLLGFLWFKPEGIIPERRRRYATATQSKAPVRWWKRASTRVG